MPEEFAQYRGRVVFSPFSPVDPEEVNALESELEQAIPTAHRSFLEVANGGTLPYSVRVPPGPQGEPVSFPELYRLGRDQHGGYGWGTLLGEYRWLQPTWLGQHLPAATLLPIARTGGEEDRAFLDLSPTGTVRSLASSPACRSGPRWGPRDMSWVLADDFDAYLDGSFIDPDNAVVEQWLDADLPGWRSRPWGGQVTAAHAPGPGGLSLRPSEAVAATTSAGPVAVPSVQRSEYSPCIRLRRGTPLEVWCAIAEELFNDMGDQSAGVVLNHFESSTSYRQEARLGPQCVPEPDELNHVGMSCEQPSTRTAGYFQNVPDGLLGVATSHGPGMKGCGRPRHEVAVVGDGTPAASDLKPPRLETPEHVNAEQESQDHPGPRTCSANLEPGSIDKRTRLGP